VDSSLQSLILGFVLTTVVGGLIGAWFQRAAWRRQARLELLKQAYVDANDLFADVSNLVDARYFRLYRWFLCVQDNDAEETIADREQWYFDIVATWNEQLRVRHNRIRMHLGEDRALAFLDYADDFRQDEPQSLHYQFLKATRLVQAARQDRSVVPVALEEINRVNWALTAFANDAADEIMRRATSLQLLRSDLTGSLRSGLVSGPQHPGGPRQAGAAERAD
jgi:hypothetical protein